MELGIFLFVAVSCDMTEAEVFLADTFSPKKVVKFNVQ